MPAEVPHGEQAEGRPSNHEGPGSLYSRAQLLNGLLDKFYFKGPWK